MTTRLASVRSVSGRRGAPECGRTRRILVQVVMSHFLVHFLQPVRRPTRHGSCGRLAIFALFPVSQGASTLMDSTHSTHCCRDFFNSCFRGISALYLASQGRSTLMNSTHRSRDFFNSCFRCIFPLYLASQGRSTLMDSTQRYRDFFNSCLEIYLLCVFFHREVALWWTLHIAAEISSTRDLEISSLCTLFLRKDPLWWTLHIAVLEICLLIRSWFWDNVIQCYV